MQKIKKKLLFLVLFISFFSLSAQETLSSYNTTWTSILPGTAICEPAVTSYGFCIATDARNIMGFSSGGMLLWEQNVGRIKDISLTVLNGDFILFHDRTKNQIRLFNPSGTELWSMLLDFTPTQKAFDGRDGRFFVYGGQNVMCLGINGIIRWKIETELQKDLPMQELPDGSVIVFISDEGGHTRGLRISPFGEKLENITFSGIIKTTETCKDGILLTFTDGSAGLFALKNGLSDSRWLASVKSGITSFAVSPDRSDFRLLALSASEVTVYKLKAEDGSVVASKTISGINGTALVKTQYSDSGLFIADLSKAILMDEDFREVWSANMPENMRSRVVNQICYLNDDYLVFCGRNWSMDAYRTSQSMQKKSSNQKSVLKNIQYDYSSFAPLDLNEFNYFAEGSFFNHLKNPSRINDLKEGLYGTDEKNLLSQTLSVAGLYAKDASSSDFGIHTEKSVFETDSAGFEAILVQLCLLCTAQTQNAAAEIISDGRNKAYCRALFSNLYGYDPDGKLLEAIERNATLAGNKDSAYLNSICDAVYSICLFMGRPAWNKKGKEILKSFMGTGYSTDTRLYARDTLKKIISLEL